MTRNCNTEEIAPGVLRCVVCNREYRTPPGNRNLNATCPAISPGEPLLGDQLAAAIALFGVPPCAGCKKHQEWLNRVHRWWKGQSVE